MRDNIVHDGRTRIRCALIAMGLRGRSARTPSTPSIHSTQINRRTLRDYRVQINGVMQKNPAHPSNQACQSSFFFLFLFIHYFDAPVRTRHNI